MKPRTLDFAVLDKLELSRQPVGVKFLPYRPEGIDRIQKNLNFCEMFVEAQSARPFYAQEEDFHCVEPLILGMKDYEAAPMSGLVGEMDGLFEELRANQRVYYITPRMLQGTVKSVVFSSVDQLTFDPDVLIITTDSMTQARIVMRASVYSTGDNWSSKGTPVLACGWIYVYPYISGEVNYMITGMSLGMQALKVLPEGLVVISIPWQRLPMVLTNLQKMNSHPESEFITGEEHKERFKWVLKEIDAILDR